MKHPIDFDSTERRSRVRYPIQLRVRYRILGKGALTGAGETVDFSSRGILIATQLPQKPGVGSRLEAVIEWPVLLDGTIHLQFVATGRIVRAGPGGFAVSLRRHEFRTMKREQGSVFADRSGRETG